MSVTNHGEAGAADKQRTREGRVECCIDLVKGSQMVLYISFVRLLRGSRGSQIYQDYAFHRNASRRMSLVGQIVATALLMLPGSQI